jgi:hypothetical protein
MATTAGGTQGVWAFTEHEHRDLARGINHIHEVACEIGHTSTPDLSVSLLHILRWLDNSLAPHVAWEEAWLYPEIDRRLGTPWPWRGPVRSPADPRHGGACPDGPSPPEQS